MQTEIENLRRERVSLRAALADVILFDDLMDARRHALRVLACTPATRQWDAPAGDMPDDPHEDPPDAVMKSYLAAWAKPAKDH
jgi:hypothetical protein